jgi:hypothetical protein
MIGRVALLVTFKKLNQNHKAYHEVIYVTCSQFKMRLTLLLIFSAPFAFTVAQDYGASTFKEILSFQMSQYLDTINCCEYDSLKNTIDKFNHQQRQKAWEIADSLSKVENPCYEFFIEFRGEKSIEDFAYYPGDCKIMWASFEILVVNSKWVIKRRRRTNITLTGSVICNEELK